MRLHKNTHQRNQSTTVPSPIAALNIGDNCLTYDEQSRLFNTPPEQIVRHLPYEQVHEIHFYLNLSHWTLGLCNWCMCHNIILPSKFIYHAFTIPFSICTPHDAKLWSMFFVFGRYSIKLENCPQCTALSES